jgi:uracil-DNA glycosylase
LRVQRRGQAQLRKKPAASAAPAAWASAIPTRWNSDALVFGPGAQRSDAPIDDANEPLWRTHYANIFNPARLNPRMMRQEMLQKYWQHLPEAHLLTELIRTAGERVRAMAEREAQPPKRRIPSKRTRD